MKTLSSAYLDSLVQPSILVMREISYKRRYWNGSAYVWEVAWTNLPQSKIVSTSVITSQLDTQSQNEFQVSNLTIVLENTANQWKPDNTLGYFGPDSGSPTYGYEPYFTKIRIQAGFQYPGSQDLTTLFTGLLTDLNFDSNAGTVELSLAGLQSLLINSNAEAVSTTVTNEALGTGDASNKVFTLAHTGVGIVESVALGGTVKRPGVDYTLSNLNDPSTAATVTFAAAPGIGVAVTATYLYWKQTQKIEDLVTSLFQASAASSLSYQISPVTFPTQITNTHLYSGQAAWEAGTVDNNVTKDGSGNLSCVLPYRPSLSGGSVAGWGSQSPSRVTLSTPTDPYFWNGYSNGSFPGAVAGTLASITRQIDNIAGVTGRLQSVTIGRYQSSNPSDVWGVRLRYYNSGTPSQPGTVAVTLATNLSYFPAGSQTFDISSWVSTNQGFWIELFRVSGTGTLLYVQRSSASSSCVTIGANSPTVGSQTWINVYDGLGTTASNRVDYGMYVTYLDYSLTGSWTSATYDTGSGAVNASATLRQTASIPSGTGITTYVDGSSDGSSWDVSYNAVDLTTSASLTIANRQYWRIRLAMTAYYTKNVPSVTSLTLEFASSATWISPALDMTTTPSGFGALQPIEALNGGTDVYYTATSSDNITWDAYVAVNGSLFPQSALKRYIKVKVVQTLNGALTASPVVSSLTVVYYTSTVTITLANFTDQTVYDAITSLAALANYEFGFTADEVFFFRPKTVGSTVLLSIDQSDFLQGVLSSSLGYDTFYSAVRASYGAYSSDIVDSGSTPTSPSKRLIFSRLIAGTESLLISADADLATGIAQAFYAYYSRPRRRFKIATKFLPQVELSDVIAITLADNVSPGLWYWGDSAVYWGQPDIYYYGTAEQSAYNLACKVVGGRIDTENWTCEYDLEEVLP